MKIRASFVTNSSSSSYCAIRIDAPMLAAAIEELFEMAGVEIPDPDDFESMMECSAPFMIEGSVINEVPGSAMDSPFTGAPHSVAEAVAMVVGVANETCGEDDGLEGRIGDFSTDVKSIEWDYSDSGWGGDDGTRFERGYYPPEDLNRILEVIAVEKGCAPEGVSSSDFRAYVEDKRCDTHESYRFDRLSGEESYSRSVTIE